MIALGLILTVQFCVDAWNSHQQINVTCPRFFKVVTDKQGLGDQLEHYVHYLYLAKLMECVVVFEDDAFTSLSLSHNGYTQYGEIADFLGIQRNINESFLRMRFQNLSVIDLQYEDIVTRKKREQYNFHCSVMFTSSIYSCGGIGAPNEISCFFLAEYQALRHVTAYLRTHRARYSSQLSQS